MWINSNGDTVKAVITPGDHKVEFQADLKGEEFEGEGVVRLLCPAPTPSLHNTELFCEAAGSGLRRTHPTEHDVVLAIDDELPEVRFELAPDTELKVEVAAPDRVQIGSIVNGLQGSGLELSLPAQVATFPFTVSQPEMRYLFSDALHHVWVDGNGDTVRVVITPGDNTMTFEPIVIFSDVIRPSEICISAHQATFPLSGVTYFTPQPSTGGIIIESEVSGSTSGIELDPSGGKIIVSGELVPSSIETEGEVTLNNPSNPLSTGGIGWVGNALKFNAEAFTAQQEISFDPVTDTLCIKTGTVNGVVKIDGNLHITGTKAFQIDHPLDPDNKFLVHSCVEAPERLNIYSGTIVTDDQGFAEVQLPDYFNVLNVNYRYQLTVIGQTFARAVVWEEINHAGTFTIRSEEPHLKVSWQVSGARNDKYAREHPIQVVVDKPQRK